MSRPRQEASDNRLVRLDRKGVWRRARLDARARAVFPAEDLERPDRALARRLPAAVGRALLTSTLFAPDGGGSCPRGRSARCAELPGGGPMGLAKHLDLQLHPSSEPLFTP